MFLFRRSGALKHTTMSFGVCSKDCCTYLATSVWWPLPISCRPASALWCAASAIFSRAMKLSGGTVSHWLAFVVNNRGHTNFHFFCLLKPTYNRRYSRAARCRSSVYTSLARCWVEHQHSSYHIFLLVLLLRASAAAAATARASYARMITKQTWRNLDPCWLSFEAFGRLPNIEQVQ